MINIFKNKHIDYISILEGNLNIVLCNLGASIFSVHYKKVLCTLTPEDKADFEKDSFYYGKSIGRFSNRLKGNAINIGDKTYTVLDNENGNTLHGGRKGLNTKIFDYEIKESNKDIKIIFSYLSKDGESGFPGNLSVIISYYINKINASIKINYEAYTDKETLCSFTNHAAYTLGETSFDDLYLKIPSNKYIYVNSIDLLPISIKKVPNCLDFSLFKKISEDINDKKININRLSGYDHYFFFKKNKQYLYLKSNRIQLTIKTSFKGTQIYSDNYYDGVKYINEKNNTRRGIAIEPSDPFNNVVTLKPNETYKRFINLSFKEI